MQRNIKNKEHDLDNLRDSAVIDSVITKLLQSDVSLYLKIYLQYLQY